MEPVITIPGTAVPLDRSDVDTDQIIPSAYLKRVARVGYADGLFAAWRSDPGFVLNDPRRTGAVVLVAGPNFGCGSSREHAAWALLEHGFGAVVAPSFADIFCSNALANGLVPACVDPSAVTTLLRALDRDPSIEVIVDVAEREVRAPALGLRASFPLDDFSRRRLLEGADGVELALRHEPAIAAYERQRPSWLPTVAAPVRRPPRRA